MADNEKVKSEGNKYYILVPKVGAQVPNIQIIAYQEVAKIENGVQVAPAVSKVLAPNGQGLFILNVEAPDHERCIKALEIFKKKRNKDGLPPVIIGPFDKQAKAFEEMHKARPKSDAERANEASAKAAQLEAENKAKDDQLAELREKLAKATGSGK
jgi:hypothetical protein